MNIGQWPRVAKCGHGVYVGSYWSCKLQGDIYDRRIHIDYPGVANACCNSGPDDLFLTLVEKEPLGEQRLKRIAEFSRLPGTIYIHCHAGACRGPTVAVVSLVARGLTPGKAMGEVADAMVTQYEWYPLAPEFFQPVVQDIYSWWQKS